MSESQTRLWRRLDHPGHEAVRLVGQGDRWILAGTAVFQHDRQACRLDYRVVCDALWHTISASVEGWVGSRSIAANVTVDPARQWSLDGKSATGVSGCIDVDLNFSPATNLLPIRRLNLADGQQAEVRAAWLRFPTFNLEPLVQIYQRLDRHHYRYESGGGRFVADLEVDDAGLVVRYKDIWQAETGT